MLANREGLFHAYPTDIGLGETAQNRLLQVSIRYRLFEELAAGEWTDCLSEGLEITGFHALECRDHSLNEHTIDSLKAALGWDGRDPFWLQDNAAALAEKPVQVKLGYEEYNGKSHLRVQFLNPYGSTGGQLSKAGDDLRRNVMNRLGAKFRALAGPAAGGSAPAPQAATAEPPKPPKHQATMEQAWATFCEACQGEEWTQQAVEQEWFRILAELFPGRHPNELTGENWATMQAEGPARILPF